jgi:hypothetical protein
MRMSGEHMNAVVENRAIIAHCVALGLSLAQVQQLGFDHPLIEPPTKYLPAGVVKLTG